jgi:hypothetical protein
MGNLDRIAPERSTSKSDDEDLNTLDANGNRILIYHPLVGNYALRDRQNGNFPQTAQMGQNPSTGGSLDS